MIFQNWPTVMIVYYMHYVFTFTIVLHVYVYTTRVESLHHNYTAPNHTTRYKPYIEFET